MTGLPIDRVAKRDNILHLVSMAAGVMTQAIAERDVMRNRILNAQFSPHHHEFAIAVNDFCRLGDVFLAREAQLLQDEFAILGRLLPVVDSPPLWAEAPNNLRAALVRIRERVDHIPLSVAPEILVEGWPFKAFLRVRQLIGSAISRVDIFDPYVAASMFHRYLSDIRDHVAIAVITSPDRLGHKREGPPVIDISRLLADERPDRYRLLAVDLHDRHLRVDDRIFQLGGSLKDAARADPFSITEQTSAGVHEKLDEMMANAEKWYAPGTTHRVAP